MSKHTKDKWVVGSGPKRMKVMAGDYCVAYVYPEPGGNAYPLRRLRLIAAALEMYELLVKLASKDANDAGPEELQYQIEDARDLLARIDEGDRDE